ncbi:MAG: response regulator [Candidatus Sericytochromatia bacterium]
MSELKPADAILLCVDDDPVILILLCTLLKRAGYTQVLSAHSAREAEETLKTVMPHLILLDIMMPEKDGYTFCSELRQRPDFAGVPVIFYSALRQDQDRQRATDSGATAFLSKPVEPQQLYQTIAELLQARYS